MTFEKSAGGYLFRINGREFLAIRNEAGFAHRQWEVWSVTQGGNPKMVEDQLPTRAACVEAVESRSWLWRDEAQDKDYIVDVYIPVSIRVENVNDADMAASMAAEKAVEEGVVKHLHDFVNESMDNSFWPSDSELKVEVGEAD